MREPLLGRSHIEKAMVTLRKLRCSSRKVFFKLFDAQVVPSLLYSSGLWGYEPDPQIEKVHMFACKMFLNVPIKTPSDTVYGELGRYSLHVLSMISCVKYWFWLIRQPKNFDSKKAYLMLIELHEKGKTTGALCIKLLLCQAGFGRVWLYGCGNESMFLKMLKETGKTLRLLLSQLVQSSKNSDRFALYSSYKSCLECEKYINFPGRI